MRKTVTALLMVGILSSTAFADPQIRNVNLAVTYQQDGWINLTSIQEYKSDTAIPPDNGVTILCMEVRKTNWSWINPSYPWQPVGGCNPAFYSPNQWSAWFISADSVWAPGTKGSWDVRITVYQSGYSPTSIIKHIVLQ